MNPSPSNGQSSGQNSRQSSGFTRVRRAARSYGKSQALKATLNLTYNTRRIVLLAVYFVAALMIMVGAFFSLLIYTFAADPGSIGFRVDSINIVLGILFFGSIATLAWLMREQNWLNALKIGDAIDHLSGQSDPASKISNETSDVVLKE